LHNSRLVWFAHPEEIAHSQIVATADAHVMHVRAEVAAPLIEQATADGTGYLTARERMWRANRALRTTGRFGRRAAARTARNATEAHGTAEDAMRRRWGDVPQTPVGIAAWAEAIAGQGADADPRVIEARQVAAHPPTAAAPHRAPRGRTGRRSGEASASGPAAWRRAPPSCAAA